MGTNITPEDIHIDFIKADDSAGENWADVNLEAFAVACRAAGMDIKVSTDADDYDVARDCGDLIYDGAIYRVYVRCGNVFAEYV
jgi:hypothetical protein